MKEVGRGLVTASNYNMQHVRSLLRGESDIVRYIQKGGPNHALIEYGKTCRDLFDPVGDQELADCWHDLDLGLDDGVLS